VKREATEGKWGGGCVVGEGRGAISPQETVERALHAAACDDCVVIAEEFSTANLRWAGNTLTTNGVSSSRRLTVIAIVRDAAGARAGVVSRAGTSGDQIGEVVAEAERAAAASSPAQDAQPLPGPADGYPFKKIPGAGASSSAPWPGCCPPSAPPGCPPPRPCGASEPRDRTGPVVHGHDRPHRLRSLARTRNRSTL
jgi:hypothetical protein